MDDRPPPIPLEYETPPPEPEESDFQAAFRRANKGTGGTAAVGVVIATAAAIIGLAERQTWEIRIVCAAATLFGLVLLAYGLRRVRRES